MKRLAVRTAAAALACATTAAIAYATAAAVWPDHHDAPAKAASATDVLGREAGAGSLRLLAFLATQPDTAATTARSQAVDLVSLQTQYGAKGLTTQIIDESGAGRDALTNTYYDWQLGGVLLAADPARALARQYDVTLTPTVVLLDAAGTVIKRWDTPVRTVQAAPVIAGKLTG